MNLKNIVHYRTEKYNCRTKCTILRNPIVIVSDIIVRKCKIIIVRLAILCVGIMGSIHSWSVLPRVLWRLQYSTFL